MKHTGRIFIAVFAVSLMVVLAMSAGTAFAAKKPNILVIWGDDIGITNISAYSRGLMSYKTPNIDRIADEGAIFTDYYATLYHHVQF